MRYVLKSLLSDDSLRPLVPLLDKSVPLFSHALIRPLRLVSLVAGIAILIAGSFLTPTDDCDFDEDSCWRLTEWYGKWYNSDVLLRQWELQCLQ